MRRFTGAVLLSCCVITPAWAGSSSGQIGRIYANEGDTIMFSAGPHQDKPACSTVGDEWALSLSTDTGKSMYALLLMAKAQGKAVSVQGHGVCSAWGDRETPFVIWME